MKQQNLHMIENLLMDVAHPDSPAYGQHWTPKKVVDFFAPSESTVSSSPNWLRPERLLDTEYHIYEHPSGEKAGLVHCHEGCLSYSVPEHISDHVHLNYHIPEYPARLRRRANLNHLGQPSITHVPRALANGAKIDATISLKHCDRFITPECLRALYDFRYIPGATEKNSYGIVEFTPQTYRSHDLDLFFKRFSSTQIGKRPTLVSIDGASKNSSLDTESDLDLEYAMVLTNPQPITLLQTGDIVEGAWTDNWLDAVDRSFCTLQGGDDPDQDGIYPDPLPGGFNHSESCGIIKPPHVVSVSYAQDEGTATHRYATRQCNEYGKLGLLGTTVLYASGDDGVAGYGGICQNSSGVDSSIPWFPGSCSFVVSVGATQINSSATVNDPESASMFSGGGFSDIFPMPSYQATTVARFLKEHHPPYKAAQFNNSGKARGFPDLSANGVNYIVAIDGQFELVSGTSASSPVVGSMISMINDARLVVGKGPVGTNPGCDTDGFKAVKGWDPVTGLGTPNFKKLLNLFLELP
ncbi:subtilisin-like protein [Lactarius deliciosus]|nr:subtilisin-like protein [Lactarius deliciosus]